MNGLLLSFLVHGVLAGPIFDVLEYGAKGDNTTDDSSAIAAAFKDCSAASGGTVLFRSGHVFRTGPVAITCNDSVIMIEPGATLMARDTTDGWPYGLDSPEPAQGRSAKQMAPLVSIVHGRNISVLGGGVLDANGEMWWKNHCGNWWCPKGYNISDPKAFRPFLFRTDYSTDIHLGNITMKNPGFWNFVPVHSQRILVEKVNVSAKWSSQEAAEAAPYLGLEASAPHFNPHSHTPNTDGFEPMWSTDVTVRGCRVDNGDDCITIKSGSSNVLVEDLYCENGDGLTIGSVWYDDVRNVTYRRVVMNRTANGPMIKGRSQGNATVSDITFEDISLHEVYLALTVDCDYETSGSVVPNIGVKAVNITFRNITGTVCKKRPNGYYGTSKKDPTFLVNAAGTFFCRPGRRCSLGLINVSVKHADAHNKTPPVWACNNSDVTSTNVLPGLPGTCL